MSEVNAVQIQHTENIFEHFPELVVHPVNCTGLCKDAFSRQLKKTWPEYFRTYSRACLRKHLQPAKPLLFEESSLFGTRYIVTLPIKNHWQEKMQPPLVKEAIGALVELCRTLHVSSVAIPEFDGPPPGWLAQELQRRFEANTGPSPNLIFLMK